MLKLLLASSLILAAGQAIAQPKATQAPATVATPSAVAMGKKLYRQRCAGCHGANGAGGQAPSLLNAKERPVARLAAVIRAGSPKGMPPYGKILTDVEIDGLVAYLRTLE